FAGIMALLKHDKKNTNGQVNFVLLTNYEAYQLDCVVSEAIILESMAFYNA
ncbi:MAG TPA: 3-dehydroquinate synthase, partial [Polaribacter sp.]|nr:3-dehydroquinate synthase [Polaribacter sp.]